MCFDSTARPPIDPIAGGAMDTRDLTLTSADGTAFAAFAAPIERAGEFACPILGLFGGADQGIPAEVVEQFDRALDEAEVDREIITYPDAPHSFFDRHDAQFAGASADAWSVILAFIRRVGATA